MLNVIMRPLPIVQHTTWFPYFYVAPEAMSKSRLRALSAHVSSKNLRGFETQKMELLEGANENKIFPHIVSLIWPSGKSMFLFAKSKHKFVSVTRLVLYQLLEGSVNKSPNKSA